MRAGVLKVERLRLLRTAAAVALAALGAGCSGDVTRFDSMYASAMPSASVPQAPVSNQPYPGTVDQTRTGSVNNPHGARPYGGSPDLRAQAYPARTAGLSSGGSIQRSVLAPPSVEPQSAANVPSTYAAPAPAAEPVRTANLAPRTASSAMKAGWNKTGNVVTLRNGETVETLSNRYGVPVKAILAANSLSSADQAQPGQEIAIPTYSYGERSGVRAASAESEARTLGAAPQTLRAPSAGSPRVARNSSTPATVTVESGDTLTGIARRSGVSVAELRAANSMSTDTVRLGQRLVLPNGASEPKRVASLDPRAGSEPASAVKPAAKAVAEKLQPKPYQAPQPEKAAEQSKPVEKPAAETASVKPETPAAPAAAPATTIASEEEKDTASAPAGTGIDQFRWPVQGRVIKRYGEKDGARRNDGLDISVPRGTPVKAAENGVVIYAGDGLKEFGNTVLVRHDNGLVTVYGHADDLKVKRGEQVRRGQEIATAGMSGDAASPMLHFEVRKNSSPVDPGKFLQ